MRGLLNRLQTDKVGLYVYVDEAGHDAFAHLPGTDASHYTHSSKTQARQQYGFQRMKTDAHIEGL